jgi:hypothetical protein
MTLVRVKPDAMRDPRDTDKGGADYNRGEDKEVPAFRD